MIYGAGLHIVRVEDDFSKMQELKVRAEAADVAKSQVLFINDFSSYPCYSIASCYPESDLLFCAVSCHCFS